jgi:hypothetical protein
MPTPAPGSPGAERDRASERFFRPESPQSDVPPAQKHHARAISQAMHGVSYHTNACRDLRLCPLSSDRSQIADFPHGSDLCQQPKVRASTVMSHFAPTADIYSGIHERCLWGTNQRPGLTTGKLSAIILCSFRALVVSLRKQALPEPFFARPVGRRETIGESDADYLVGDQKRW